ncbi:MAG TPA: hypothetical protein PKY08_01555 [Candidatus Magasanikbacteria bacterium]|nr:hypothetical protein [Candidatus Magasanikbacteria bacterium]
MPRGENAARKIEGPFNPPENEPTLADKKARETMAAVEKKSDDRAFFMDFSKLFESFEAASSLDSEFTPEDLTKDTCPDVARNVFNEVVSKYNTFTIKEAFDLLGSKLLDYKVHGLTNEEPDAAKVKMMGKIEQNMNKWRSRMEAKKATAKIKQIKESLNANKSPEQIQWEQEMQVAREAEKRTQAAAKKTQAAEEKQWEEGRAAAEINTARSMNQTQNKEGLWSKLKNFLSGRSRENISKQIDTVSPFLAKNNELGITEPEANLIKELLSGKKTTLESKTDKKLFETALDKVLKTWKTNESQQIEDVSDVFVDLANKLGVRIGTSAYASEKRFQQIKESQRRDNDATGGAGGFGWR